MPKHRTRAECDYLMEKLTAAANNRLLTGSALAGAIGTSWKDDSHPQSVGLTWIGNNIALYEKLFPDTAAFLTETIDRPGMGVVLNSLPLMRKIDPDKRLAIVTNIFMRHELHGAGWMWVFQQVGISKEQIALMVLAKLSDEAFAVKFLQDKNMWSLLSGEQWLQAVDIVASQAPHALFVALGWISWLPGQYPAVRDKLQGKLRAAVGDGVGTDTCAVKKVVLARHNGQYRLQAFWNGDTFVQDQNDPGQYEPGTLVKIDFGNVTELDANVYAAYFIPVLPQ